MTTYNFSLVIEGADLQSEAAQNALYEAGCDDATFGSVDEVEYAEFSRDGGSYGEALFSAMAAIRRAIPQAKIARVEPDDFVTMSEIAERTHRSRESIRLLISGERGTGDFPVPVTHLRSRNRMWRWSDVLRWFATRYEDEYGQTLLQIRDLDWAAAANAVLTEVRYEDSLSDEDRQRLRDLSR